MNKASPFPQVARKKHATMKHIDPDLIEICNDPYVGVRSSPKGKYDEMFSMLKPGQCLKCEPHESAPLATALRKWLQTNGKDAELEVRAMNRFSKDGRGRVWLLAKEQKLKRAA